MSKNMRKLQQSQPHCDDIIIDENRIGGVMVSVLASSSVDPEFKPKTMKLVFVASPLSTQH